MHCGNALDAGFNPYQTPVQIIIHMPAMPRRHPNAELRRREHLTEGEVERLIDAAKGNRWGLRDATMVLVSSSGAEQTSAITRVVI